LEFKAPKRKGKGGSKFVGQLFVCSKSKFVKLYRLATPNPRQKVPASIEEFYIDVGVPDLAQDYKTHFDGAGEHDTAIRLLKKKYIAQFHTLEANRQHGNLAERYIGDVKRRAVKLLERFGGHERLDYLLCDNIPDAMNTVAKKCLNWKSPIERLTGKTPDISIFRFRWWEPIWFLDSNAPFFERMRPGFFLSIAHATGDEFCYNVQPLWDPKDETLPGVLQRGVVLPRYPNEKSHGGAERPPSGHWFPTIGTPNAKARGGEDATPPTIQTEPPGIFGKKKRRSSLGKTVTFSDDVKGGENHKRRKRDDPVSEADTAVRANPKVISEAVAQAHPNVISDDQAIDDPDLDEPAEDLEHEPSEEIADEVDPVFIDDINNELEDQGIGLEKDQFSAKVIIVKHRLKNGVLTFHCKFGGALLATKASFDDLRTDVPATVANYILLHGVGKSSEDPASRAYYTWATGFLPSLRRAMIRLVETYGVTTAGLGKEKLSAIRRMANRQTQVGPKPRRNKKSKSPNRRPNACRVKYGILIPNTIAQALDYDKCNGNTKWDDAMFDEMQTQVDLGTYKFLAESEAVPEGYQETYTRMIFEAKQDLRHKGRYIIGGDKVEIYDIQCYSSNMKGISARLLMLIADANGYDVRTGDIKNAYLNAFTQEKVWIKCGPEFSRVIIDGKVVNMTGRKALVVKALYGLKSSGRQWHKLLSDVLRARGWVSSRFDADVWYRLNTTHDLYEYIGTHTDDLLVVGPPGTPSEIIEDLRKIFTIKSSEEPTFHLGCDYKKEQVNGEVKKVHTIDKLRPVVIKGDPLEQRIGKESDATTTARDHWFLGTKTYIGEALLKCAAIMQLTEIVKGGKTISPVDQIRMHKTPISFKPEEHPAADASEPCSAFQHRVYQQLLGIALWIVICGRYDICYAVSVLSAFSAAPRKGHLERVYHLIGYLRKFPEKWIIIDSSDPGCVPGEEPEPYLKQAELKELYPDVVEDIDPKAPPPKGKELKTTCFFDAAMGNAATRGRGHTGIMTFVGRTPVFCMSKRQGTAEPSSYGCEFIAARQSVEEVIATRGALRALGVPILGPTKWYGDNLGMLQSSSLPESTLRKRHVNIAYHMCREQVAAGVLLPIKVHTGDNLADTGTKALATDAIEHHNKVIFARPFQSEAEIAMRRLGLWYEAYRPLEE
jgi:hypothetical protein